MDKAMDPRIKMGTVVFDRQVKEHVLVTNGIETPSTEFQATEGIALRTWRNLTDETLVVAWTYRQLDPEQIVHSELSSDTIKFATALAGKVINKVRYIGRI